MEAAQPHLITPLKPARWTGGGETLAVGAKSHAQNIARAAAQGQQFLAALRIPYLRRIVLTRRGEAPAIGAKSQFFPRMRCSTTDWMIVRAKIVLVLPPAVEFCVS